MTGEAPRTRGLPQRWMPLHGGRTLLTGRDDERCALPQAVARCASGFHSRRCAGAATGTAALVPPACRAGVDGHDAGQVESPAAFSARDLLTQASLERAGALAMMKGFRLTSTARTGTRDERDRTRARAA